jgi:hypothetical protein
MDPVTVSVDVKRPRQEVFDYIEVLRNHEAWMDHLFKDWRFEGPACGVGGITRARVDAPGSREQVEIKVVESTAPAGTVEECISAHGKRLTRGTYRLSELPAGGTKIEFEIEWLKTPRTERIVQPLSRAFMRRANAKGMRRLAALLEGD